MSTTSEKRQSLWLLTASPSIWAAHFLLSYATASIWCAKNAGPASSLAPVQVAIALYTVLALGGIGIVARLGYRRQRFGIGDSAHAADTAGDRHRFLGFATYWLSGVSAVAVLYAALVVFFFETCH